MPERQRHPLYDPIVLAYNDLRALYIMRNNIAGLLTVRRESQTELAKYLHKDKSWINKFLNGSREVQLKDLDRIAEFFGIAAYQLFQPGTSHITERRTSRDRRSGHDRRVSRLTNVLNNEPRRGPRQPRG